MAPYPPTAERLGSPALYDPAPVRLDETSRFFHDALQGNARALGELLERLRPRLVLWAASRMSPALKAKTESEDVAQEILLTIHKDFQGFQGTDDKAFFGWVFRVAENRIRDLADYHGAQKRRTPDLLSFSQTSPSAAASRNEQLGKVHRALASLPDDYRQVIQLHRLEERPAAEVAEIMDRSAGAVRVLYCRALKALREAMGSEGGAVPSAAPL